MGIVGPTSHFTHYNIWFLKITDPYMKTVFHIQKVSRFEKKKHDSTRKEICRANQGNKVFRGKLSRISVWTLMQSSFKVRKKLARNDQIMLSPAREFQNNYINHLQRVKYRAHKPLPNSFYFARDCIYSVTADETF